jgi:hypothetical protein
MEGDWVEHLVEQLSKKEIVKTHHVTVNGTLDTTSDGDFSRLNFKPGDIPQGVVWLHPPKSSKDAIRNLLDKFCRNRQENFSEGPYDFRGQIIEVTASGVSVSTASGLSFHPWAS